MICWNGLTCVVNGGSLSLGYVPRSVLSRSGTGAYITCWYRLRQATIVTFSSSRVEGYQRGEAELRGSARRTGLLSKLCWEGDQAERQL